MNRKLYRFCGFFFCILGTVLWVTAGLNITAYAKNVNVSMKLICVKDDVAVKGMEWKLYKIGSRQGDKLVIDEKFAECDVSFDNLTANSIRNITDILGNYAESHKLKTVKSGKTDKNGEVIFKPLDSGLYMAYGKRLTIDECIYIPLNIIFEVDETNSNKTELTAYPKLTRRFMTNSDLEHTMGNGQTTTSDDDIFVTGSGSNIGQDNTRPTDFTNTDNITSVTENTNTTVVTNTNDTENNNTTVIVDTNDTENNNTTVVIDTNDTENKVTVVTNENKITDTTDITKDRTDITKIDKLPQTSQLWWPVPVMAGSGIVLIAIGIRLSIKE